MRKKKDNNNEIILFAVVWVVFFIYFAKKCFADLAKKKVLAFNAFPFSYINWLAFEQKKKISRRQTTAAHIHTQTTTTTKKGTGDGDSFGKSPTICELRHYSQIAPGEF